MKLFFNGLTKLIVGIILIGLCIFLPAGTFYYPNGILFMILLFVPIFIMGIILFIKKPKLLEKRLDHREKQKAQKGVVAFSALIFIVGFVMAGLDFRFSLLSVPKTISVIASVIFLLSYCATISEGGYFTISR